MNSVRQVLLVICLIVGVFALANAASVDDFDEPVLAGRVTAELIDGSRISGELLSQDSAEVVIRTASGVEMKIPRHTLRWLKQEGEFNPGSRFDAFDPNYSRLTIMPTARPLRQGAGFVSDTWLFFPSVSYGVTDNVTVMAGMSIFPFIDLSDQIIYLSPKIGTRVSDKFALAVGTIYIRVPEDDDHFATGVAYGVATYGGQDSHVTIGLGWGYFKEKDEDFQLGDTPATLIGGYLRITEVSALLFETWYFPYEEYEIKRQPFGVGIRMFGERIAVDAGAFTTADELADGHIIPWLAAVYNFGALK
jgi:hypothetical protein